MTDPTDPLALARALIRCPSVTPDDAGAIDVVDVGDLLEEQSQHRWGGQSLREVVQHAWDAMAERYPLDA